MISLLGSMLRARWAQALTAFLLSVVATAAAVAGPVALRVVDSAIVDNEVASSPTAERSVGLSSPVNPSDPAAASSFQSITTLLTLPGLATVRAGELRAFGPVPTGDADLRKTIARVAFRDELCLHVVIVSGRCLAGSPELILGVDEARRAGLRAGDEVDIQAEAVGPNGQPATDGEVSTLSVAGIYRPRDPTELYWAAQYYFPTRADGTLDETIFVTAQTFDLIDHRLALSSADVLVPTSGLTSAELASLPGRIDELSIAAQSSISGATVTSQVPALAARVRHGQALAHELVPVAFLPLVGLSWFVVFLAVGYGVGGRRAELGLVALRGVRSVRRWGLGLAEPLLMILIGAPVGYLVGHLVVGLAARISLGGAEGAQLSPTEIPYAAVALGGALLVALLGQRRALREPVVELLRGVPSPAGAWRSYVGEALLVILAILGVLQLRRSGGLTGVSLLVPGLVVVAVTLLAARAFVPMAGLVARLALRRGRLGAGLAAVQIARRPGSQRLFALVAVATGLLAFAAAGQSVAAQARDEQADVLVGATTVLTIDRGSPSRLLLATHAVDPAGAWAMAAMPVPQNDHEASPVLAVDGVRLAAVAAWRPEFGQAAARVGSSLQPPAAFPFLFRGDAFTVDIERGFIEPANLVGDDRQSFDRFEALVPNPLLARFGFESLADGSTVIANVPTLNGRHQYPVQIAGCTGGCRLTGYSVNVGVPVPIQVTLYGLQATQPAADVLTATQLTDMAHWRGAGATELGPVTGGLRAQLEGNGFDASDIIVSTLDAPTPVPIVATAGANVPRRLSGVDGQDLPEVTVGTVAMLPRLGGQGILVDLSYLQRVGAAGAAQIGQVWLGPDAPADAVDRLRKAGLTVLGSVSAAGQRRALDHAGPALALRFHVLAAVLGIGLAVGGLWLVAAVDRRRRADDLRALRSQGLRRRFVRRAALWGYLCLVLGAAVSGLLAAAGAWLATGDKIPVLTDSVSALPPPRWPQWTAVVEPWAAATAGLVVIAVVVAVTLWRAVSRTRAAR